MKQLQKLGELQDLVVSRGTSQFIFDGTSNTGGERKEVKYQVFVSYNGKYNVMITFYNSSKPGIPAPGTQPYVLKSNKEGTIEYISSIVMRLGLKDIVSESTSEFPAHRESTKEEEFPEHRK